NPDVALVTRVVAGDRDAFEALVTRHQNAVFRFARTLTRTREDAEDVLQETFLAAYKSAVGFRGEASVRTWLLIIARNAAFRIGRRTTATTQIEDSELWDLGLRAGWGQDDPESLAVKAQRRDLLQVALSTLEPASREIIVLRDLEGLSGEEAAQVLGLTVEGMKSRLHRARLKLAAVLREGGGYGK
ncbi:MAG TPA: sigma-70 family RNA polymerase sigma factor, partial [Terriglobales bacterium]|nr:sigma-70 family RNA polymerase sigma factor [Terriglobales bacterium]